MASERRKIFVDTRQLALALRRSELKPSDLGSGLYYLECTRDQLRDFVGQWYPEYAELFRNIFFGHAQVARSYHEIVYRNITAAIAAGRGAFRERGDVRRLCVLNKLTLPFLKDVLGAEATGIEARDFYDALKALPYYFDVI